MDYLTRVGRPDSTARMMSLLIIKTVTKQLLPDRSNKYCIFLSVCVCVCVHVRLIYPACTTGQAPHCLRPLWLHHIFQHYLINGTIFGKMLPNIKCVFLFYLQLLFNTFLILGRIQRDTVINVKRFHVKSPLLLSDFNETLILSTGFRNKSKFIKIRPAGPEFFHADGQTDMTKLVVAFRERA